MNPIGLFLAAAGAFSIVGALCDWDWFMDNRKARPLVKILTRTGARIFYFLLGLSLFVLGALVTIGVVDLSERTSDSEAIPAKTVTLEPDIP